jgi:hypothetical protein
MPQTATIKSLRAAFAMMKAMQAEAWSGARTIATPPARRSPRCSKAARLAKVGERLNKCARSAGWHRISN